MSESPMFVFTTFFGTKVNAANAGVGFMNSDGTYNVSGTLGSLRQATAQDKRDVNPATVTLSAANHAQWRLVA